MHWQEALRARMLADASLMAACAGLSWTRRPNDGAYPWLTMHVIVDGRAQHLKGFTSAQEARVQFSASALTRKDAVTLLDRAAVAVAPAGTFSGVRFGRAILESRPDTGQQTETGYVHRLSFDATFLHD